MLRLSSFCRLFSALVAIVGFARAAHSAETDAQPRIVATAEDGGTYLLRGFETVGRETRPYYYLADGTKAYLASLADVSIDCSTSELAPYLVLPDSYRLIQGKRSPLQESGDRISILNARFDSVDAFKSNQSDEATPLHAILWIRGESRSLLYLNRPTNRITSAEAPLPESFSPGGNVEGHPALVVFVDGRAQLPPDNALTLERIIAAVAKEQVGRSDFSEAIRNGISPSILQQPQEVEAMDPKLRRELIAIAASYSRVDILNRLLPPRASSESGPRSSPAMRDRIEFEAAAAAMINGHSQAALALVSHPHFENSKVKNKRLLAHAITTGEFEIADQLLADGYEFAIPHDMRKEVVRACLLYNRVDYLERLQAREELGLSDFHDPQYTTIYHRIAPHATPSTLDFLHQFRIPIDQANSNKFTPLIYAAGYGNIPAVCWLLDRGARMDHRNKQGHTALQYSIIKQQQEATACLLQQGSDVNLPGPMGVTPLMQAALFRDVSGAAAIAEAGGMWNLDSSYLDPCLDFVLQQDLAPTLRIAFEQGLASDHALYGKWPLSWIAAYYDAKECRALADSSDRDTIEAAGGPLPSSFQLIAFDRERAADAMSNEALPGSISFALLVTADGDAHLPVLSTPLDRFLENDLRNLVASFRFSAERAPTLSPEASYKVVFELQIPKSVDRLPGSLIARSWQTVNLPQKPGPSPD